jgi:NAD(P)-dependent dehydrogenase (short-subunit alcohol dehydrogenase family)
MTKYFASLYADKNVNVNMLSPGPIFNKHNKKFVNQLIKFIPKKRMGNPVDLISAIEFLIDNMNPYMTGHNLIIDGGRTVI